MEAPPSGLKRRRRRRGVPPTRSRTFSAAPRAPAAAFSIAARFVTGIREDNPPRREGSTQEALALLRGDRPAEEPPLGAVAAVGGQEGALLLGLDALGDDRE